MKNENVSILPFDTNEVLADAESTPIHSRLVFRAVCCNNIAEHIF